MEAVEEGELGGVRYEFQAASLGDGERLRCGLVFVQGLGGLGSGREGPGLLRQRLAEEGCASLAFDLLQGAPGKRCSLADFHGQALPVCRGMAEAIGQRFPKQAPVALVGFSYGFTLALLALAALAEADPKASKRLGSLVKLAIGVSPALKIAKGGVLGGILAPRTGDGGSGKGSGGKAAALDSLETDARFFKGALTQRLASSLQPAGAAALQALPQVKLPFLLLFGSEDFALPPTEAELGKRSDIEVRLFKGGRHDLAGGDTVHTGRTIEAALSAIDKIAGTQAREDQAGASKASAGKAKASKASGGKAKAGGGKGGTAKGAGKDKTGRGKVSAGKGGTGAAKGAGSGKRA